MPATEESELSKSESWFHGLLRKGRPVVPLLALVAGLPYLLIYLKNLFDLSHYQFFPLVLGIVCYLGYKRWGGALDSQSWSTALLCPIGIAALLAGTLFASSWASFLGFCLCLASWLGAQKDIEGGNLAYLSIPIFLIWQPPFSSTVTGDTVLIQNLQLISAKLSSRTLDMLGYIHHQPGTVLEVAGRSFGVEQACSGIQSFFAVLSVGAIVVVLQKRRLIHAVLLLSTSPFWAVLMNTLRITLIPIAYVNFGMDLAHGWAHSLLGYFTMILAIFLMLSTDELLKGLIGWIPTLPASAGTWGERLGSVFPQSLKNMVFKSANSVAIIVVLGCCGLQAFDFIKSFGTSKDEIDFFRNMEPIDLEISDLTSNLNGWLRVDYEQVSRDVNLTDLGQRSDSWRYNSPSGTVSVSFDQLFPGWHELTRCYKNGGWKMKNADRSVLPLGIDENWKTVEAKFTKDGEHGYLLFSLVNHSGRFLEPPEKWDFWSNNKERLQNRLTPAVRSTLFGAAAYQIQLFVISSTPLSGPEQQEMLARFRIAREQLWNAAEPRIEN
ncbi:MAG: exosortase U [Planctomycetota bacterium]